MAAVQRMIVADLSAAMLTKMALSLDFGLIEYVPIKGLNPF